MDDTLASPNQARNLFLSRSMLPGWPDPCGRPSWSRRPHSGEWICSTTYDSASAVESVYGSTEARLQRSILPRGRGDRARAATTVRPPSTGNDSYPVDLRGWNHQFLTTAGSCFWDSLSGLDPGHGTAPRNRATFHFIAAWKRYHDYIALRKC